MNRKRLLVLALVIMMVVGLTGGMAWAVEPVEGIFVEGIFGINRNTADVWKLDPNTGGVEKLFNTGLAGSNVGPNGLAYDAENGLFYYVTYTGAAKLYVYDGNSATLLHDLGDSIASACFYDGKYYYIASGTDDLKEVVFDASGAVSVVNEYLDISSGQFAWTFNGDIAISEGGLIYGFGLSGGKYQFFTVERDGSDFTLISEDYNFSLQLAFEEDGTLIGHDARLGQGRNFEVDTTSGELTELSVTADGKLFTDLAQGWVSDTETYGFCGYKYVDGVATQGWIVKLEVWDGGKFIPYLDDNSNQVTATTGSDGKYCFDGLPAGTYRASEVQQDGYTQIYPVPNEHIVVLPTPDPLEAPYPAYSVVDYSQGLRKNGSAVLALRSDPEAVLTYDLGQNAANFFSLGFKFDADIALAEGGWIILEFDCPIRNGEDDDIMVVEDTWGPYPLESADVYASKDGVNWVKLGTADNTSRDPVFGYHTVTYFDLDNVGMDWAKFIKVVDTTPIGAMPADGDGFDLNTIVALHDCEPNYDFYNETVRDPVCETAWAKGADAVRNNEVEFERTKNPSNAWGWTNKMTVTDSVYGMEMDLWAAAGQNDTEKGYLVGKVVVEREDNEITVTYLIDVDLDCWFSETHLWIGKTALPLREVGRFKTKTPTSAPGQFLDIEDFISYSFEDNKVVYVFDASELEDEIWIAAHAVVCCYDGFMVNNE